MDELVVLAVVLGVPVPALLLPIADDVDRTEVDRIAVTPSVEVSWYTLAGWLRAQWGLSHDLSTHQNPRGWRVKNLFSVMDDYATACNREAELYRTLIDQTVQPDSPDTLRYAKQLYEGGVSRYVSALTAMLDHGMVPPRPRDAARIIENYRKAGYVLREDVEVIFTSWEDEDGSR